MATAKDEKKPILIKKVNSILPLKVTINFFITQIEEKSMFDA